MKKSKQVASGATRRKFPRIPYQPQPGVEALLLTPTPSLLQLVNLSSGGLAARNDPSAILEVHATVSIKLSLLNKDFILPARVAHRSAQLTGFEFTASEEEALNFKIALRDYYNTELMALQLERIPSGAIGKKENVSALWWRGGSWDNEVYLEHRAETLTFFHIRFMGQVLEWSVEQPKLKVGIEAFSRDLQLDSAMPRSLLELRTPNLEQIQSARTISLRLVDSIEDLPDVLRQQIKALLQT